VMLKSLQQADQLRLVSLINLLVTRGNLIRPRIQMMLRKLPRS
jgi:hypothetical protein